MMFANWLFSAYDNYVDDGDNGSNNNNNTVNNEEEYENIIFPNNIHHPSCSCDKHYSTNNNNNDYNNNNATSLVIKSATINLTSLPNDAFVEILSYLNKTDIFHAAITCKHLYQMIFYESTSNFTLWKVLCLRDKILVAAPKMTTNFSNNNNSSTINTIFNNNHTTMINSNHNLNNNNLNDANKTLKNKKLMKKEYNMDPYRELYLNYENTIGKSTCEWFCRFNLIKLEWELNLEILNNIISKIQNKEICIVTALQCSPERNGYSYASQIVNNLLGIDGAFPDYINHNNNASVYKNDEEILEDDNTSTLPCLYMYTRPLNRIRKSLEKGKNQNVLFLRAYNLFEDEDDDIFKNHDFNSDNSENNTFCNNESNLSSINHLRKCLMRFIILFSSTIIICKEEHNNHWINDLDNLVDPVSEPPLFGTFNRSLLVCNFQTKKQYFPNNNLNINLNNLNNNHLNNHQNIEDNNNIEEEINVYDLLLNEVKYQNNHNNNNNRFISLLLNWFGKIHGINIKNFLHNTINQDDLWCFINDITSKLQFGSLLSRWNLLKSNGTTCKQYLEHVVKETNRRRNNFINNNNGNNNTIVMNNNNSSNILYEKILTKFAKSLLKQEMQKSLEFYKRAVKEELNPSSPLEMEELVKLSEMHAETSIRMFTQSIASACFQSQMIEQVEQLLKHGINNNFRILWRENARNSEEFCQQVWNACFKWMKAEFDCPSYLPSSALNNNNNNNTLNHSQNGNNILNNGMNGSEIDFCQVFESRFFNSLNVYLDNAKGTKKIFIMNFCSKQYIEDLILPLYSSNEMKEKCHSILSIIENMTLTSTIKIDLQRTHLQKLSTIKLKLLTIENTIERLKEEIKIRKEEIRKSEEQSAIIEDRMNILEMNFIFNQELQLLLTKASTIRNLYIESAAIAIQNNIELHCKYLKEYEQLLLESNSIIIDYNSNGVVINHGGNNIVDNNNSGGVSGMSGMSGISSGINGKEMVLREYELLLKEYSKHLNSKIQRAQFFYQQSTNDIYL
ncbi:hypothetical protein ABK040_006382 [Willaertia magna]